MVNEVFHFLCSAFVIPLLAEVTTPVFVSVHETSHEKREQMRRYYRNRRNRKNNE